MYDKVNIDGVAKKGVSVTLVTRLTMKADEVLEETEALPASLLSQYLNQFLIKYSQTLISFAAVCERKLMQLQIRINRVEKALGLLEKKLGEQRMHFF